MFVKKLKAYFTNINENMIQGIRQQKPIQFGQIYSRYSYHFLAKL